MPPLSLEDSQKTLEYLRNQVRLKQFSNYLVKGLTAGAGIAGLGMVGRALIEPSRTVNTSYTEPVETVVYRPDRKDEKKGAKTAGGQGSLTNPLGYFESQVADDDWLGYAVPTAAAAIGIPTGYLAIKGLSKRMQAATRRRELRQAQREFEEALQQYAEAGDESRKVDVAKMSGLSHDTMLMRKLAANCCEIAERESSGRKVAASIPWEVLKGYAALAIPTSIAGGYYGFKNRWENRKQRDLDTAERQVNLLRESSNPTFSTARLEDPVDLDPPAKKRRQSSEDRALAILEHERAKKTEFRQAVEQALDNMPVSYL